MKLFQVQRPARWLFDAFGIIAGVNPQNLGGDIAPVVDVMQGGVGTGVWTTIAQSSGVGLALAFTLAGDDDDKIARLIQLDISGAAAGAQDIRVSSQKAGAAGTVLQHIHLITPAGTGNFSWAELARGQQWIYVPPGYDLIVTCSAIAGLNNTLHLRRLDVPAGVKPW